MRGQDSEPEIRAAAHKAARARTASQRAVYSVIGAAVAGIVVTLLAAIVVGAMGLASWRDAFFGTHDEPPASPIAVDGYRAGALISDEEMHRLGEGLRDERDDADRQHAERLKELDQKMDAAHERLRLEDPAARFGPDFGAQPPAETPP